MLNRRNFLKLLGASAAALALNRPTVFDMGREMAGWSDRNGVYRPGILAGPGLHAYTFWWESRPDGSLAVSASLDDKHVPVTDICTNEGRWAMGPKLDSLGRVIDVVFTHPRKFADDHIGGGTILWRGDHSITAMNPTKAVSFSNLGLAELYNMKEV